MSKEGVPLLGGNPPMRTCNCVMRFDKEGGEIHCPKAAVFHIAWNWNSPPDCSFACLEHQALAGLYEFFQIHRVGADCGMPGAVWDGDENKCVYPDGFPVKERAEEQERVGVS